MRLNGRCHCGLPHFRSGSRSGEGVDLPLHRLPGRLGLGLPRQHSRARQYFQNADRRTDALPQDDGGQRQSRVQAFCPICGTPIYSTSPGDNPDSYMLRTGTLRQRDQLTPKQQNWFRSARPWVTELGSIPRNEKGRA